MAMGTRAEGQHKQKLRALVSEHSDFPIKGVNFLDVFPIFRDPVATEMLMTDFTAHLLNKHTEKIDVVVGLDARYIFNIIFCLKLII